MLDLRRLRYFLAIADEGSVTKAAAAVHVAQPSISRQIRQLEELLGAPLFERQDGRLRLSAAGQAFLPVARDLAHRADVATNFLRGTASASSVSLSLVAPETTVADLIAPFLAQRGQRVRITTVREAIPSDVFAEVVAGTADLGVSSGPPPGALDSRPIIRFAVLAYVRADDPLAHHRSVALADLVRQPLILLGAGHGTRRIFDDAVAEAGLSYAVAAETDVPQIAQAMAASGRGIAVVTDDRRYGLRPLFIETSGGRLTLTMFAAWDRDHYATDIISGLVDDLAAFAVQRYPPVDGRHLPVSGTRRPARPAPIAKPAAARAADGTVMPGRHRGSSG